MSFLVILSFAMQMQVAKSIYQEETWHNTTGERANISTLQVPLIFLDFPITVKMESNRPVSEGSVVQSAGAGVCDAASSDDHQQVQSQARSYECSFCKKGFSNAQALGGHMNIHRKDKAKLKKAAAAARLPPESSRSVLSASSRITNKGKPLEFTSRQILGKDIKWGDIFRGNHVHQQQQQQEVSSFPRLRNESQMAETMIQLPLFVETKTAKRVVDYSKPLGQQHVSANWQEQMLLHSTNGGGGSSSMSAGLDLELRLGHSPCSPPPPPESSTVTTGSFLKFF